MKIIFLTISFILLNFSLSFGQYAAVDIPLSTAEDTISYEFFVGLDLSATNCVDTLLGECIGEPPFPPPGIFFSGLNLPTSCGQVYACKDYRPPGNPPAFPFSGLVVHTLWWQVSSPGISSINLTYNLPAGTILRITDNITGTLLNLGPFTGQGVATIPASYTAFGTKALLKMEYDNIVPVELTSLTVSVLQSEKAVQLNWTTATETNNSGFEILRFTQNDNEWETIGFVPGFGTATEPKIYSFVDENVTTGNYKYRLKQIDFDGSFTYSIEIEVVVDLTPKEFVLYQNYPNPFNPNTTIKFEIPSVTLRQAQSDIKVSLKVYDILSNEVATLVNEEKSAGKYEIKFNPKSSIKNPASGVYFYQLKAGSLIQTKKMILLR